METLKKGVNIGGGFMVIRKPDGSVTTIDHRNDAWGLGRHRGSQRRRRNREPGEEDASVTVPNVEVDNGVIHGIDAVLMP